MSKRRKTFQSVLASKQLESTHNTTDTNFILRSSIDTRLTRRPTSQLHNLHLEHIDVFPVLHIISPSEFTWGNVLSEEDTNDDG